MAILVTGGAGFIGSHLVERLLESGIRTICLDNFNDFYDPNIKRNNVKNLTDNKNFHLIDADIRDRNRLEDVFNKEEIETVVHLAAMPGVRASIKKPKIYEEVNITGTLNLLEVCAKTKVKKFIYGSSSSVYGLTSKLPFSEEDRVGKPISPYAASKESAELFCYTFSHLYDLSVCCFRFFTVYGPRQRPEMAIHKFTRYIDEGLEVPVYGDGTSKRDYTYISDIISGIESVLNREFGFEIFNLGNSECIELHRVISLIERFVGKKARIKRLSDQPGDVRVTYADISKSSELLGYKPKVKIEEGIEKFVAWFKNAGSK